MRIEVKTKDKTYPIEMERGLLYKVKEFIGNEQVFLISDDGVPEKYRNILQEQFPNAHMYVMPQGEASKCFQTLESILKAMLDANMTRNDIVVALGGGVVGDISGFAAATYMRGIRYINIPTTTLSQIDSSIGGKTAIDLNGYKNSVGAFWQPEAVLIDFDVLNTLPERHFNNGLVEAIKAGLIKDEKLFELFEDESYLEHIEEIIEKSIRIKKEVVENDEREKGERKLLNFGHTYGHAYESYYGFDRYYHGECVAMGMMSILKNEEIKSRLENILQRLHIPSSCDADKDEIVRLIKNDKKAKHDAVTIVQVDEIGNGYLQDVSMEEMRRNLG